MIRKNLVGGSLIEVKNLESVVATLVDVPKERDGEGRSRILAYLKGGEIIEVSDLEARILEADGVSKGTMDDVVEVTLYETESGFEHYVKEDIDTRPEAWADSLRSEVWTLRRCNIPLAMAKFVDYRTTLIGMEQSALDLKEGRVTQEEIDEQVRRDGEMKRKGIPSFLQGLVELFSDGED